MTKPTALSTGIPGLDDLIGGYHIGDNVIVHADVGAPPYSLLDAAMSAALERGDSTFYVAFDRSPATVSNRLTALPDGELTLVDCFTHGKGRNEEVFHRFYDEPTDRGDLEVIRVEKPHRPAHFHHTFDELATPSRSTLLVVDSLSGMAELWGSEDHVREFYTHTCPRLFDTEALALWVLQAGVHTEPFRAAIGHTAQVVLRLMRQGAETKLRLDRAEGRYHGEPYQDHTYREDASGFTLVD